MENNNNHSYPFRKTILLICCVIVILFLFNLPLMIMCPKELPIEYQIGISCFEILSFAVAIWASLNIANYFDRQDFEKFKETSKNEMSHFKNEMSRFKDAQENVTKEINEKNEQLGEIYYAQFLQELLRTIKNPVSEKFYNDFNKSENSTLPYERLLTVERLYAQVYELYFNGNESVNFNYIKAVSNKGIDSTLNCLSFMSTEHINNSLVESFLFFRNAEFIYYSNYKTKSESTSIDQMKESIELYTQALEKLGIKIKNDNNNNILSDVNELNRKLCAYSLFSIGSVYIWLHEYNPNDYVKNADMYCSNAVTCAGTEYQREVYFRNCGVAKEHTGDLDAAYKYYEKALETPDIRTKTTHCMLSVLDKQINNIIKIEHVEPDANRSVNIGSSRHLVMLKDINISELKRKQNKLGKYCNFTKNIFSKHVDGYLYSAIYYRNCTLINLFEHDQIDIAKNNLLEAQHNLEVANLLDRSNKYAIVIGKDLHNLDKLIKQQSSGKLASSAKKARE